MERNWQRNITKYRKQEILNLIYFPKQRLPYKRVLKEDCTCCRYFGLKKLSFSKSDGATPEDVNDVGYVRDKLQLYRGDAI